MSVNKLFNYCLDTQEEQLALHLVQEIKQALLQEAEEAILLLDRSFLTSSGET